MTVTATPLSTSRLLAGPAVLVLGAIGLAIVSMIMSSSASLADAQWALFTTLVGLILAGLLLAWRAGMGWARWAAWGVAVLAFALSAIMLVVGIWAAGYYESPPSDLPLLLGLPPVVLVGSGLILWTVIRRRTV